MCKQSSATRRPRRNTQCSTARPTANRMWTKPNFWLSMTGTRSRLACYQLVCHFKCHSTRAPARAHHTRNRTTNFCVSGQSHFCCTCNGSNVPKKKATVKTHDCLPPTAATATACARIQFPIQLPAPYSVFVPVCVQDDSTFDIWNKDDSKRFKHTRRAHEAIKTIRFSLCWMAAHLANVGNLNRTKWNQTRLAIRLTTFSLIKH